MSGRSPLNLAAADLGAESGRVVLGRFDGRRLALQEVHRFANEPVQLGSRLHWDFLRLWLELERGLAAARRAVGRPLDSVAVDTWGVDFALFADSGELLGNPYHYRGLASEQAMQQAFSVMAPRTLFELTAIQRMPINTLFQLVALKQSGSAVFQAARHLLMLPGAFTYLLSGERFDEFTSASTSQLYDPRAGGWSRPILDAFGLPESLFATVLQPGTVVGRLLGDLASRTGLAGTAVAFAAGHDTACAVAAVPAVAAQSPGGGTWAYISSGTWSLVGVELPRPVITDAAYEANLSNEGGVFGTFRLLKNVMGLWLVQACRRQWAQEGQEFTYEELTGLAEAAPPRRCFIDPDEPGFLRPGDPVGAIREFCRRTEQPAPEQPGEVVRCILESLALKYRWVIERIEEVTSLRVDRIHVVGGGSRNGLLCQLTADCSGRPVIAGPAEATAAGNLLLQAHALREVGGLEELRAVVRDSFATRLYEPRREGAWEEAYRFFQLHVVAAPEPGRGGGAR